MFRDSVSYANNLRWLQSKRSIVRRQAEIGNIATFYDDENAKLSLARLLVVAQFYCTKI